MDGNVEETNRHVESPLPPGDEDESDFETELDEAIDFDPFEGGSVWTQAESTQALREAWKRGDNPRSDDATFEAVSIVGPRDLDFVQQEGSERPQEGEVHIDDSDVEATELTQQSEHLALCATSHSSHEATQEDDTWWRKGKTAPLLDQYDEQRRLWYMIQAGVFEGPSSVHDANATVTSASVGDRGEVSVCVDLTDETDGTQSTQGIRPQTLTTPQRAGLNATGNVATPLCTSNSANRAYSAPQRATLSLAGNVNWPIAAPATPIQQSVKRKTWSSTMAKRQQERDLAAAASTGSSSAKKRRQSAGRTPSTPTSIKQRGTPSSRGRR